MIGEFKIMAQTITKIANLINPEVMGTFLDKKMIDLIKFSPLAVIGHDLQGNPGDTLTIPTWNYIGDAEDLAEGVEGNVTNLTATTSTVKVKKAVKNVGITDEARLSAYGDPMGQIEHQLAVALASKVDKDVLEAIKGATTKTHTGEFDINFIADALVQFGEDIEETTFVYIHPKNLAILRKSPEFVHVANGQVIISGQVGTVYGCPIVVSNKMEEDKVFFIRQGAIGIEVKREVSVETDRDVLKKQTIVSADRHYMAYVRDASKLVKGTISPALLSEGKAKAKK